MDYNEQEGSGCELSEMHGNRRGVHGDSSFSDAEISGMNMREEPGCPGFFLIDFEGRVLYT